MKIGIVCPYNMFRGGGVQECVIALQAGLEKRGHTAKIITPQPRASSEQHENPHIIFIGGATDIKSPFHTTAQISAAPNNETIDTLLAREQFDLLHFHEPWVPMLSRQILSRCACPVVATFHAKLPESVMSKTIERVITPYTRSILKYLDGLSAVSEAAALYVRSLTQKPITIIPNGIDLQTYKLPPKKHLGKTILYIGRLEKRKGVKYLLKAFELLTPKYPDATLIIAGDGPDRAKLEDYVRDKQIPHVTFKGFVSQAEKLKLMADADLFCSPALYGESFGIVLLEAMAMGIVTVAGNNPGYASVLREHGRISLINPKEIDEFASRLELLLTDQALRQLWQSWALDYVQQFNYEYVVKQYEDLYLQTHKHATTQV
ncbi:MAG: hypothetical protein JWS12_769 [Candidatus Saccharibacteria bacterium]|nr:hypothetical protein [Candidatus Saccharibacteria bacterium]